MPRKNPADRRRVLIRLLLDLHALIRETGIPHEQAIVALSIRLGHYEGRAMDVSDIAETTSLPLSSVSRHIKSLRRGGRVRSIKVGRRTLQYMPLAPEPPEVTKFYTELYRAVLRASIDISNVETSDIDKG